MKKTNVLIIVLILISILLTASTSLAASTAAQTTKFAVYALNSEPLTNWDPAIEFSNGIHVHNNMYEQLLRYDSIEKKVIPLLAESYTVSEDGLTWTFKLREGVKFQNGDDFTAEDVKFSIDRTMALAAGASYIWSAVESVNVIDPLTVEFKLAYKTPLDLVASTGYAAFIYSSKCVNEDNTWIEESIGCGTGPYKLKSSKWGDEVILESFADYWGGWSENSISILLFKKVSEPATRRQMIETGEATITVELPFSDVNAMKDNPNVVVSVNPSLQNLIGMFNTLKPPLDDVRVRQALAYSFPYQEVIDTVIGGYGQQSYGMVPAGLWGWSDQLPRYEYNLEKAKTLLEEAGVTSGLKLLLTYTAGNEAEKSMAELYKSELAKLNIDLEIRGMPWDSQWELSKGDPETRQDIFVMYWWPDLPSPYSFLYSTFHSEEEPLFNLAYYNNPTFDQTIDDANELTSADFAKAESMFVDAQKMLLDDAASLFIYDRQDIWVTVPNLKGFKFNPAYPTVVFFHDLTLE
ncbi:MAG: ABC transporter substrate-binding protein [Flexilinea sp.]|jgi:peptide/nickel transport system substrate-binding protein